MKNITIKLNTSDLNEKLSQLIYHLEEAKKLIDSINSIEAKSLIELQHSS